jgi:hypothetical protein
VRGRLYRNTCPIRPIYALYALLYGIYALGDNFVETHALHALYVPGTHALYALYVVGVNFVDTYAQNITKSP